jgi:serine/threonine protein kinase
VSSKRDSHELNILQTLASRAGENGEGFATIIGLLDSFYLIGPNGNHQCLVLEPAGPSISATMNSPPAFVRRFEVAKTKSILRQILLGLRFLHDNGIVHGDVQPGNLLFVLQGFDSIPETHLRQEESDPRVTLLQRKDGKEDRWAPRYLVEGVPLNEDLLSISDHHIKISDFGGGKMKS